VSAKKPKPSPLPAHESAVRRLVADAAGTEYTALHSLAAARAFADAVVVLEGDYGGQIYVVAPVSCVKCEEAVLHSLLAEIDAMEWTEPEGASVFFERLPVGTGVPGGMGGAVVQEGVWVHERLHTHRSAIVAVLAAERASIRQ
jgi:hypothetical protein